MTLGHAMYYMIGFCTAIIMSTIYYESERKVRPGQYLFTAHDSEEVICKIKKLTQDTTLSSWSIRVQNRSMLSARECVGKITVDPALQEYVKQKWDACMIQQKEKE